MDIFPVGGTPGNVRGLRADKLRAYYSALNGTVPTITVDDGAGGPIVLAVNGLVSSTVPQCVVRHSVNQSINDVTDTALVFDTEVYDSEAMHSTASNTDRITAVTAGKYLVTYNVSFASNATGIRALTFRKNGTNCARKIVAPVNGERTEISGAFTVILAATDYINVLAYQSSGGALNCETISSVLPRLEALWVNP